MFKVQLIKIGGNSVGLIIPKIEVLDNKFMIKEIVKVNITRPKKKNEI